MTKKRNKLNSQRDLAEPRATPCRRSLIAWIAAGLAIRLIIAAISSGTNDAATFLRFGMRIDADGLLTAYQQDPDLNHPPIPALWAWTAYKLSGGGGAAFPFVFKLPVIAAEAGICWLLWRVWRDRKDAGKRPFTAAVGYAFSLCAILVSGYHCNTDTVYAGLGLLSAWLLTRGKPLGAGLALAGAINIKLIPILLVPGLLLSISDVRSAIRFLSGLAVGVLPFIPVLLKVGPSFYANALAYGSMLDKWGIQLFLLPGADQVDPAMLPAAAVSYYEWAKYPILALIVIWSLVARVWQRCDRYQITGLSYSLFLVLAPGFGLQYTVIVVPLLLASRPMLGHIYSLLAGVFIGAAYFVTLTDDFPLYSQSRGFFPQPTPWIGLTAWLVLLCYIVSTVAAGVRKPRTALTPIR